MIVPNYENTSLEQAIPWSMILKSKTNHKEILENFLKEYLWQITALANHLGVSWTGMKNKIAKEGIEIPLRDKDNMVNKIKKLSTENMTSEEIRVAVGRSSRKRIANLCRVENIPYKKMDRVLNLRGAQLPKVNPLLKKIKRLDHSNMNSTEIANAVGCGSIKTISYLCREHGIPYIKRGRYKNTIEKGE